MQVALADVEAQASLAAPIMIGPERLQGNTIRDRVVDVNVQRSINVVKDDFEQLRGVGEGRG